MQRWFFRGLGTLVVFVGIGVFLYPGVIISHALLTDEGLRKNVPSRTAFKWHHRLAPRYERWARERVASGVAATLTVDQLEATEWPLFGSCFFLWATEKLQAQWEANNQLARHAPKVYAREAIEAATLLVLDPNHAKWVRDHWSDDHLHHENVFYRGLIVSAITSHYHLTGSREHLDFLGEMTESLAKDIGQAPSGLLEDYPGECYPADVIAGLAAVKRASQILGRDCENLIKEARRTFTGRLSEPLGIPAYAADVKSGEPYDESRGCGNSYITTIGHQLWPDLASEWFKCYEKYFFRETAFTLGFREFPRGGKQGFVNLDSGPVIDDFGVAASAFGTGACRVNGRFDLAYPLTAEMLVASWPLPNRALLVPKLLSHPHAPLLGETSIVYQLSQTTATGIQVVPAKSRWPWSVRFALLSYFLMGLGFCALGLRCLYGRRRPR